MQFEIEQRIDDEGGAVMPVLPAGSRLLHHDERGGVPHTTWIEHTVARCLPVVLGFRHVVHEPPHRFATRLIHGPFDRFEHLRRIRTDATGTWVHDRFDVKLSWPYGGEPMTRLLVVPIVRRAVTQGAKR